MGLFKFSSKIIPDLQEPHPLYGVVKLSLGERLTAGNVNYGVDLQFKEQGGTTQTSMGPLSASFTAGYVDYTTSLDFQAQGGTSSKSYSSTLPFGAPDYTTSTNLVTG